MSIQQNPKAFRFQYTARDQSGARKTGHLEASDSQAVTMKLRAQGLFPVEVTRADAPVKAKKATLKRTKTTDVASGNLSRKQTADLVSRLAKLTGRRVPVERALAVVADGEDAKIASTAAAIRKSIREGAPLSTALQNEAGISDTATLSLIRGAEVSGELAEALDTAANLLNQRIQLIRRIGTGLMYPCLLLVVAAISLGLILIAIIPQFRPLVEDRMDQVPAMGRAIFFVSEIMVALWPLILGTILIAAAAILIMRRMGKGGAFGCLKLCGNICAHAPLIAKRMVNQHRCAGTKLHRHGLGQGTIGQPVDQQRSGRRAQEGSGLVQPGIRGKRKPVRQAQNLDRPALGPPLGNHPARVFVPTCRRAEVTGNGEGNQRSASYHARATWLSFSFTRMRAMPSDPGPKAPERAAPAIASKI
jgi:hypothetical protein